MSKEQEDAQKAAIEGDRVARIKRVLAEFNIDFAMATWFVHGKIAIYHTACEQIADKAGITFTAPTVIRALDNEAVFIVYGQRGGKTEWSTGEAKVATNYKLKGNQPAYVYAMAEKRGKDRVTLKLIGLHGDLYSESEADDFKANYRGTPKAQEIENRIRSCNTVDDIRSLLNVSEADLDAMDNDIRQIVIDAAKARARDIKGGKTTTQTSPPPPPAASPPPPPAAQKQTVDVNAGSFGAVDESPDSVLNEFGATLKACRTQAEVVEACDQFRKAIMEMLPPDKSKANDMRANRLKEIAEGK